jgi:5-methyltetrahydropteroyltriglutamate--homocysteine methyltransferase
VPAHGDEGGIVLLTTTIGAYPKPDYVTVPDWFGRVRGVHDEDPTQTWAAAVESLGERADEVFARGTRDAVTDQVECGIDIPTDGEIRREDYIHYHCRNLHGIDFARLTEKSIRSGAVTARLPTIAGPIRPARSFLPSDWQMAQSFTDRPVKITLPGPMTITDSTFDDFYGDEVRLGAALADALNSEVKALVNAGCRHIQIDEPLFARKPAEALSYGVENLERAIHGCPPEVVRTVHMCCGYPDRLGHADYPKAPPESYFRLAAAMEDSVFDAVSIEDAHRHNDLTLLEVFRSTTVILGVVAIADFRVEGVEEIRSRLLDALEHIDHSRLMAAPDCGLGLLGRDLSVSKLRVLCEAAHSITQPRSG